MRIVSLVPSLTEAVAQLGRGDDLVAVTDYCLHPADVVARLPRIGGTKDPDLDAIAALEPDVILANTDEQRSQTLEGLAALGCDVVVTETDSLAEVAETWTVLGRALDADARAAEERERLEAALARASAAVESRPRLSVLVPVWRSPWMASGGGTYIEDLLGHCGFDNVLAAIPEKWARFVTSTDPALAGTVEKGPAAGQRIHALPQAPDVVLLPTEPYAFTDADRDAFVDLGVGRERVRVVDGELLTWWLSRSVDALDAFAQLHGEFVARPA